MGMDTYTPKPVKPGCEDRQTLIQGIANAEHTLELVLAGDASVALKAITIHAPPLK